MSFFLAYFSRKFALGDQFYCYRTVDPFFFEVVAFKDSPAHVSKFGV
jgi:hypothetical protein